MGTPMGVEDGDFRAAFPVYSPGYFTSGIQSKYIDLLAFSSYHLLDCLHASVHGIILPYLFCLCPSHFLHSVMPSERLSTHLTFIQVIKIKAVRH